MSSFWPRTALAVAALLIAAAARAEMSEIKVAQQYGIRYLPLMIMEERKLIEKHAKAAGVDVTVGWARYAGGNVMNDALLSGSLQVASGGVGPLVTLWARTKGNLDVKAVSAINSMPLYLNTRNPNVKTIRDFTDRDRIALPAVKVSIQAITLQMAAEKAFVKAVDEATAIINGDRKAAAETCLRLSKDKDTVADILAMLNDPAIVYTTTPQNTMQYVNFMLKTGAIKVKPESWKDLFFPNARNLSGS